MKPRNLLTIPFLILAFCGTSSPSFADANASESRFSLEQWARSFEETLSTKSPSRQDQLLHFQTLEETALPKCADCKSKETMQKARELFAQEKFADALNLYNQIPKGSDYWFQAIEEKGWTYFRMNDSEKALAQSKTLISPQFAEIVNTEAYFLRSLTQLKLCDYKGVFETHQTFKEKQKERITAVQKMSAEGTTRAFLNVLNKIRHLPLQAPDVAESLPLLPVLYYKDLELQRQILRYKVSDRALQLLQKYENPSSLHSRLVTLKTKSFQKMNARLKELAQEETLANQRILQKLNLIEVEAIQRMHADMSLNKNLYSKGDFKRTQEDQLVFMDDGKPWIDELDKYDVAAKACPQNIRRKM